MWFTMIAKKMSLSTLAPKSGLATIGDWCSNNKMGGVAGAATGGKVSKPCFIVSSGDPMSSLAAGHDDIGAHLQRQRPRSSMVGRSSGCSLGAKVNRKHQKMSQQPELTGIQTHGMSSVSIIKCSFPSVWVDLYPRVQLVHSIINLSKQEAAKSNKDLILGMGWAIASRSLDMYESHPFASTPAKSCEAKVQQ